MTTRVLLAASTILIGLAVAACGSSNTAATPRVASLQSGGATATTAAAASTDDRPRLKLVMTQQDWAVALAPYNKCLLAHGLTSDQNNKIGLPEIRRGDVALYNAAQAACADQYPLPAWENDPKNPDALDFNRQVVACLHNHGVKEVEVDNVVADGYPQYELSFGGPENDPSSISLGLEYVQTCQQQVSQSTQH